MSYNLSEADISAEFQKAVPLFLDWRRYNHEMQGKGKRE
jgi:hypothetical protein